MQDEHRLFFGIEGLKELRFFGRRKGKEIKPSRQKLMDVLLPRLMPEKPQKGQFFDLTRFFGITPREIWLEVGFGGGEHVAALAERHRDVGFLGAEPFLNGVSSLLAHLNNETPGEGLDPRRVDNVRVWPDDVRQLFPHFPDATFSRVFVLYPDPWPKARHAERRFINQANLTHLKRLMPAGGLLCVATDVAAYAEWAEEQVALNGAFERVNPDMFTAPDDWVSTRYEQKGVAAGRRPHYLIYRKKA